MDVVGEPVLEELVSQARGGCVAALGQVVEMLAADVMAMIRQQRIHANDCDDAGQQAVVIMIRCVHAHQSSLGGFRAYACTAIRNMLRGLKREQWQSLDSIAEPIAEPAYEGVDVEDLLEKVPNAEIVRRYFGIGRPESNLNQIGAALEMSPAAVTAALAVAFEMMRKEC